MFELKLYVSLDKTKKHPLFSVTGKIDEIDRLGKVLRGTLYDGCIYTLDLPGVTYGEVGTIGSNPIGHGFELVERVKFRDKSTGKIYK